MLIDRPALMALIPHAGAMCLLDGALEWDAASILCTATSHTAPGNPLRHAGRLGILCGVEYAGQAMALHAALLAAPLAPHGPRRVGVLAAVRAVSCHAARLDDLPGQLLVAARRLDGNADHSAYAFFLRHGHRLLLEGRATVAMGRPGAPVFR